MLNNLEIVVDNLKCNGCAATITKQISSLEGIEKTEVNVEKSSVGVTYSLPADETAIKNKLANLGYPEQGTSNNIQKAKSYVSCAIGKVGV